MTRLAIVTGASRGMGLAIAAQLLDAGWNLLTIQRKPDASLDERAKAKGRRCEQWAHDLARPAGAATRLVTWLQAIDASAVDEAVLVNNAALLTRMAPLGEVGIDELSDAIRVDLETPLLLASAFLRGTAGWPGSRKILNISSGLGRRPMAASAMYCSAKAGMDHFTRCIALEEAARPNGAKAVSLAPGVIDTDMQVHLRASDPSAFPDVGNFIGLKDQDALASPHEAAAKVLAYLARPDFGANPVADVRDP